ncbi:MAG: hypothetical protein AMJ46_13100 [Latescibacteria bacterium DG_63]|nr:MAG: hypothetical protein AMJ46_13100 [Latescibacteria bacterium DG_63]
MPKTLDVAPAKVLKEIKKKIVTRFPEMKGVRPTVVKRRLPPDADLIHVIGKIDGKLGKSLARMKGTTRRREIYCASFEKKMKASRGAVLRKIVRVTFDREGHILKLVSSK